jgi:hypothetical protein
MRSAIAVGEYPVLQALRLIDLGLSLLIDGYGPELPKLLERDSEPSSDVLVCDALVTKILDRVEEHLVALVLGLPRSHG